MKPTFPKVLVVIFLVLPAYFTKAQGVNVSEAVAHSAYAWVDAINLPQQNNEEEIQRASLKTKKRGNRYRLAKAIPTKITLHQDGTWLRDEKGNRVWRLVLSSPNARGLSLRFDNLHVPLGSIGRFVSLEAKSKQKDIPLQPKANGSFWFPVVNSKAALIELVFPGESGVSGEINTVYHHFRNNTGDGLNKKSSGSCNVDVVCSNANGYPQIDAWRDLIRSVGMLEFEAADENGDLGIYVCSGALINNTKNNQVPYLLTAQHCIMNETEANSTWVYWNFQSSTCRTLNSTANATPVDYTSFDHSEGTTLVASWGGQYSNGDYFGSDFTLLQLEEQPDPSWNLHYAGWERRSFMPFSAVGIHHANGDEKRISFENNAPLQVRFSDNVPDDAFMEVTEWDLGVTEVGSSGSPLFNQAYRIVGQLNSGESECGSNSPTTVVKGPDYYGRLFTSWNGGGTAQTRLKDWLDPLGTAPNNVNGTNATIATATEPDKSLPGGTTLKPAFPNPFQSETSFLISVPKTESVQIRWFNAAGQEVKPTINSLLEANTEYRITFNGTNLPNGIYLYQIKGSTFSETGKVTLLR